MPWPIPGAGLGIGDLTKSLVTIPADIGSDTSTSAGSGETRVLRGEGDAGAGGCRLKCFAAIFGSQMLQAILSAVGILAACPIFAAASDTSDVYLISGLTTPARQPDGNSIVLD